MVNDDLDLDGPLISRELAAWANRKDDDEENPAPVSIRAQVAALLSLVGRRDPDALLTGHEVAVLLGLSDRTLERYRAARTGPAYIAVGGLIRYLRRDVLAFIEQNRRLSTSDLGPDSESAVHPIQRVSDHHNGSEVRKEARLAQRRMPTRKTTRESRKC
jgi:predicted DNA-binding transcriptional regulator AlpA